MTTILDGKKLLLFLILVILSSFTAFYLIKFLVKNSTSKPSEPYTRQATYGEFLSWKEVNQLLPKYGKCTIIDFETGQQFRVQRRGGSSHADVQPLQAADTATFKSIYGQWSWKRRAVLVQLDNGQLIAASINGMPHGSGAIKGNNFNGHFCLHFRDSKTHSSGSLDPAHQVMIWKAAGVFEEQMASQTPEETIRIFITLLDQGDYKLGNSLLAGEPLAEESTRGIKSVRIDQMKCINDNTYSLSLRITSQGSSQEVRQKLNIVMIPGPFWKIQSDNIQALFQKQTAAGSFLYSPDLYLGFKQLNF